MKNPKEKRIMMKCRAWGVAVVLAIGAPAAALAQSVIQSITSSQQSGSEVVQDAAGEWIERNSTLQLLERGAR